MVRVLGQLARFLTHLGEHQNPSLRVRSPLAANQRHWEQNPTAAPLGVNPSAANPSGPQRRADRNLTITKALVTSVVVTMTTRASASSLVRHPVSRTPTTRLAVPVKAASELPTRTSSPRLMTLVDRLPAPTVALALLVLDLAAVTTHLGPEAVKTISRPQLATVLVPAVPTVISAPALTVVSVRVVPVLVVLAPTMASPPVLPIVVSALVDLAPIAASGPTTALVLVLTVVSALVVQASTMDSLRHRGGHFGPETRARGAEVQTQVPVQVVPISPIHLMRMSR